MSERIHSLSSEITFGKYRDLTVGEVCGFNPRYLRWASQNLAWFKLDAEAQEAVRKAARADDRFASEQQNLWAHGFGLAAKTDRERRDFKRIQLEHAARRRAGYTYSMDGEKWQRDAQIEARRAVTGRG